MTDRNTQLRRALVTTVEAAPFERSGPRRLTVVAAIAAFALAGSLTGFATASVSRASTGSEPDDATTAWVLSFARAGTEFAGPIHHVGGAGASDIPLGPMPPSANGLLVVVSCTSAGSFSELLDTERVAGLTCDDGGGGSSSVYDVAEAAEHTFRVESADGAQYEAWAAWVREPPLPEPSAQQLLELSDGTVTREEYVAAFNRYLGCLGAAGYDMGGIAQDDSMAIFSYSIPGAAVDDGTDERCYISQFNQVDMQWQVSQQ